MVWWVSINVIICKYMLQYEWTNECKFGLGERMQIQSCLSAPKPLSILYECYSRNTTDHNGMVNASYI